MDATEFRKFGHQLIDWIADYMETLHTRCVVPNVQPGFLRQILPASAPEKPEEWEIIFKDFKEEILRGVTHWCHPSFMAYFPIGMSYPAILGELASSVFGVGFSWAANPSLTELEKLVMDWMVDMLGLPRHFRHDSGVGGGVMQCSASDCILVSMMTARRRKLEELKVNNRNGKQRQRQQPQMVAYCSELAHSCVEKAASLLCIQLRQLPYGDDDYSMEGGTVEAAIERDLADGRQPFFVCCVLGTTACASCDNLASISSVCQKFNVWCHVDAAYVGSAFLCEEHRVHMKGIEFADSLNLNASKWMLSTFDTCILWVKNADFLVESMRADPLYLLHSSQGSREDLRNWGVHLSRRFRALKLWFVIRSYGVEQLRTHVRRHCHLAKQLRDELLQDSRFQLVNSVNFSLVCVRFRNSDLLTKILLCRINESRHLHIVPATVKDQYIMRFAIVRERATIEDVENAAKVVISHADAVDAVTIPSIANNHTSETASTCQQQRHNDTTNESGFDRVCQSINNEDLISLGNSDRNSSKNLEVAETSDLFVGLSEEFRQAKWRILLLQAAKETGTVETGGKRRMEKEEAVAEEEL